MVTVYPQFIPAHSPRVFAIIGMSSLGFQLKRALRDNRHHLGEMQTKPLEKSPTQKFFPSLITSFIKAGWKQLGVCEFWVFNTGFIE